MKTNDNGRAEARSRADRRLRRITIGTAVLGVVATGSLGGLAAFTYDGTSDTSSALAAVTMDATTTTTTTAATPTTSTSTATATPSATAAATTSATATAAPTVTTAQGNAHATTGGS